LRVAAFGTIRVTRSPWSTRLLLSCGRESRRSADPS
jgi:hypothetical protein